MSDLSSLKKSIALSATKAVGASVEADWVEIANPKAGSHLALPCFRLSKELGKNPAEIATEIAATLDFDECQKAEPAGPYVNIWLKADKLAAAVERSKAVDLKDSEATRGTVVVEFASPNLAKPLSIGHLRNVLQGKALALMHKHAGFNVITDNHIGDWGTVFGMWVIGFERFSSDEQLKAGGVKEMGRMYVEIRKALKAEEAAGESSLANDVQIWLQKLEAGDDTALAYHKRFSDITLSDLSSELAALGIVFDHNYGESFYIERGKELVEELVTSGVAIRQDDNSVIINLEDKGIDTPLLIEKSNGASLYATSDIATIEFRETEWNPDKVIYVVGSEQRLHFRQLFAANQIAGWSDAELIHHDYGLIEEIDEETGKRQKMSSRRNAVYLSELYERAQEKAREIAPDDLSEDDITAIAQGAVAFGEFSASHSGNTLFDWDSMFSLSGFSGPYVQYAAVRVGAVLAKSEQETFELPANASFDVHADLLWRISQFSSVVEEAVEVREGHKIAEYAYDLAREWNRFYENNPILDSSGDEREVRLWIAATIGEYLNRSLSLIGIGVPGRM